MDAFYGEIRAFGFNFAPTGWAYCSGQSMSIQQYSVLFALLGTTFGGDGKTSFKLPNLCGQAAIGCDVTAGLNPVQWGQYVGVETVTLNGAQLPLHNHALNSKNEQNNATAPGATASIANGTKALRQGVNLYAPSAGSTPTQLYPTVVTSAGGNQAHENRQPFLTMNYCICLDGYWPQQQ